MKRERVAVITTSYPSWDGDPSGHFVSAEAHALERAGHDVHVLAARGAAFGWPGVLARVRDRPSRAVSVPRALADVRTTLMQRGPWDRVIAHWLPTAAIATGITAPLEVVAHGSDVRLLKAMPAPARALVTAWLARTAASVRAVSESLARELLSCAPFAGTRSALATKLTVRPPPFELHDVEQRAAALREARSGTPLAVTVARLVPSKRVDRVIEHVAQRGSDALVVVGDGPERSRLEAMAIAKKVDATFVGLVARREALAWIRAADVLVFASREEGLSTVLREAEALGTRVEIV